MRSRLLLILAVSGYAQVVRLPDGHPDLGSDGVWMPARVADLTSKGAGLKTQPGPDDPAKRCLPPGVPRIMLQARPFEIVQTPERVVMLFEGGAHVWRQIWMDGRGHPKNPNPNWLGHSTGRWDGDVLVVDTVDLNDKTWLDDAGHPHTEQLHVTEKFALTSATSMKYEVRIDDPGAYTKPWTFSSSFSFRKSEKLAEDICLDKIAR